MFGKKKKSTKEELEEMDCPLKMLHANTPKEWRACATESIIEIYVMIRDIQKSQKTMLKIGAAIFGIVSPVLAVLLLHYLGIPIELKL